MGEIRRGNVGERAEYMSINFDAFAWGGAFVLLSVFLFLRWRKTRDPFHLLFVFLFSFYLILVVRLTVFPIYILPYRAMQGYFMDNVNLIPFYFGPGISLANALSGIILNTLLTMPIGFGINFIMYFRPRDLFRLVAIFGFGIEGMQLLISLLLGYPYRAIDVNDVIFNSLGVVLGYGFFRVFASTYLALTRHWGLQTYGIFRHIHEVVSRTDKA